MSCVSNVRLVDSSLVDKILEQGQKLRNAMIGSILRNDLLNSDVFGSSKHFNTPEPSSVEINEKGISTHDEKRLEAFINGECLTKEEEKEALETLRSLSASDLYKTTERSLKSTNIANCRCDTCEMYYKNYPKLQFKEKQVPQRQNTLPSENPLSIEIQERYRLENKPIINYIDSIRISVGSLILNTAGHQKLSQIKTDSYLNFFLEYNIADIAPTIKKSKVDSGLTTNNVRVCCKKIGTDINFKYLIIHDGLDMRKSSVNGAKLEFKISYRNSAQKISGELGYAVFDLDEFLYSKNLSCSRGLIVMLNRKAPISVGILKVTLQLGCAKLYFGQELIDAIQLSQRNNVALESDDNASLIQDDRNEKFGSTQRGDAPIKAELKSPLEQNGSSRLAKREYRDNKLISEISSRLDSARSNKAVLANSYFRSDREKLTQHTECVDKDQILFGFLYISEAQYLTEPITSYITCQPFCQNETSVSRVETDTANPQFHFQQLIPLVLDDSLLYRFRENYSVIKYWNKKESTDEIFGLTKISLHQFYLAYRNLVILKYLAKNTLPVVCVDWWEPINFVDNTQILGQVQVLIALGTEEQIKNLKSDRGFSTENVKAKPRNNQKVSDKTNGSARSINLPKRDTNITKSAKKKSDVATQSDLEMEQNLKKDPEEKKVETQEILETFLSQLMTQKPRNVCVENGTNTEPVQMENGNLEAAQLKTNSQLRKTTDLLESLQKVLTTDKRSKPAQTTTGFKASIAINSANHLPVRKKCRSKRSKHGFKHEDNVLPSCYVSFETFPNADIRVTAIIPRSTNPVWNYKCETDLPLDLLENSQKRFIFKVWKKSNSTVASPNMQADTVLGFAALDLSVLSAGLPNVQGWFNIVDFSGKCNGQLNVHITPLEDMSKYHTRNQDCSCEVDPTTNRPPLLDQSELLSPLDQSETLSRALKRKFTELDEITQRLRLRLSKVTNEESDASSDGFADEFDKDINTLCIEEDFDLVNFEGTKEGGEQCSLESEKSSNGSKSGRSLLQLEEMMVDDKSSETASSTFESVSTSSLDKEHEGKKDYSFDKHLQTGKQHISSLLEKLSLLSAEANNPFQSRYVSGCSVINDAPPDNSNIDTEAILQELDHFSRPNIQSSIPFIQSEFNEIYDPNYDRMKTPQSSESTSLISTVSDCRIEPEGQGRNIEEEK